MENHIETRRNEKKTINLRSRIFGKYNISKVNKCV